MMKIDCLTKKQLRDYFISLGEEPYRGDQVYKWIYGKGVKSFSEMTDLPAKLQEKLTHIASFTEIRTLDYRVSTNDGSIKFLFLLEDGNKVESVALKDRGRITLCISSQVGCRLGCEFCTTGRIGFIRNLSCGEILGQVIEVERFLKKSEDTVSNIVYMGMGEPLDNLDEVLKSLEILTDDDGLGFSHRRVTVSTAGLVDKIDKLFEISKQVNLAVSLNATTDRVRDRIMPVNKRFNISNLMTKLRTLPIQKRKRITIEYVLIKGVNDTLEDAKRLIKLIKGLPVKVNLIVFNPGPGSAYSSPTEETVQRFQNYLVENHITAFLRKSLGKDIDGACGQLYAKYNIE
ncbi:MAG: 23S rRNA (adenine(2503)-C(2))-methyltransferase RlmN [Calditerrivibrio sp.]|nr:23S rRNA (adenine(2503)-C(2))-methyltransferase RlmN [Calditerrivibrio sp.]